MNFLVMPLRWEHAFCPLFGGCPYLEVHSYFNYIIVKENTFIMVRMTGRYVRDEEVGSDHESYTG